MAKNNLLIQRAKELEKLKKTIDNVTPEIYSAIALALHRRYGWGFKRINDLFCESQAIWYECLDDERNMIQICEDETGIECQAVVSGRRDDG